MEAGDKSDDEDSPDQVSSGVDHDQETEGDGVLLSIGSDLDEFPDDEVVTEPGEICLSNEDTVP